MSTVHWGARSSWRALSGATWQNTSNSPPALSRMRPKRTRRSRVLCNRLRSPVPVPSPSDADSSPASIPAGTWAVQRTGIRRRSAIELGPRVLAQHCST